MLHRSFRFINQIHSSLAIFCFALVLLSLAACTAAKTSQTSLGLTYSAVDVSQGNVSSKTITVAYDTAATTFKVGCSSKLNHAQISWDNGASWSELPLSDVSSCTISTTITPGADQTWPTANALIRVKGDDGRQSDPVAVAFVKPKFSVDTSSTPLSTFKIENGSGITNKSTVSITNSPVFGAGSILLTPREISISTLGCGAAGESDWKPYGPTISGIQLASPPVNGTLYPIYVYYRDASHNTSSCLQASVLYDNVAPTLTIFTINNGAYQSTTQNVSLNFVSSDDSTSDAANGKLKIKITNGPDCSGGTWNSYVVAATLPWTLPGPGQDYISAQIQDVAGNISTCVNQTISYSPYGPADPTTLSLVNALPIDNKNPVSVKVAPVLSGNTAYVYADSNCSSALNPSPSQHTSDTFTDGAAVVQVPLSSDANYVLYARVVNPASAASHCSAVNLHYQLDTAPAIIQSVTSSSAAGPYATGQAIDIALNFNKVVTVTGTGLALGVKMNGQTQQALYAAGSGTSTLHFSYNIKSTDFSMAADIASTSALTLGLSSIIDSSHNAVNLTLPSPGSASSLAGFETITVNDLTTIALGSGINAVSNLNPVRIAVGNLASGWTAKVFTDSSCANLVGTATSASSTSNSVEVSATLPSGDGVYTLYAERFAPSQMSAPCSSTSVTYKLDSTNPQVSSVTTTAVNGNHITGEVLEFVVNFSAPVNLSGANPTLKLRSNGNAVIANYDSGSGTSALHFKYTVLASDLAAHLDYFGTSALTTSGTIQNSAGSNAVLTLPAIGATGSISSTSQIQLNYTQALTLGTGIAAIDKQSSITIHASGVINGWSVGISQDSCATIKSTVTAGANGADFNIGLGADGPYTFKIQIADPVTNTTSCSTASVSYTLDTTGPVVTSVTSTTANGDYPTGSTIDVSVNFNEPAFTSGVPTLTLALANSATANAVYVSGSGTTTWHFAYTVAITDAISKLNYASTTSLVLGSATLVDALGNAGDATLPATSSANSLNGRTIKVNAAVHVIGIVAPLSRVYYSGDILEVVVKWSGPVTVSGTTNIGLVFGTGGTLLATYSSSQSSSTEFRYVYTPSTSGTSYLSLASLGSLAGTYSSVGGGTVTTSLSSVSFSDSNLKVRATAAPILTYSENINSVNETAGSGSINFGLSVAALDDITVNFNLAPLSNFSSGDYSLGSTSVTIPAGSTSASLTYNVTNNSSLTGMKSFAIQANGMSSGRLAATSDSKFIAIHDNDFNATIGSLAVGLNHVCALFTNGAVRCSGDNSYGQLGNGTTNAVSGFTTPITSGANKVVAVENSTCAILDSGSVVCWGSNSSYRLGTGSTSVASILNPTAVSGLSNATDLSMSISGGCAIYANGSDKNLKCWGYNYYGRVGDGTTTSYKYAATSPIVALSNVTSVSAGYSHTCVIANSVPYCWGYNASGQLGFANSGSNSIYPSPLQVSTNVNFTQIVAQSSTTCGLSNSGGVYCWGTGTSGERGDGTSVSSTSVPSTPINLSTVTKLVSNRSGGGSFCAQQASDSNYYCWGYNGNLESGTGLTSSTVSTPTQSLFNSMSATNLFKGDQATCIIDSSNSVECMVLPLLWRRAIHPSDSPLTPFLINQTPPTLLAADQISCSVNSAGRTFCNSSSAYALGDGSAGVRTSTSDLNAPVTTDLSVSGNVACSVDQSSILRCWGNTSNYGLGNGIYYGNASLPSYVLSGASKVRAGAGNNGIACALKSVDGSLWCWGYAYYGQLGAVSSHALPFPLVNSGVSDFANAGSALCIIVSGKVKCIGQNSYGQVGDTSGNNTNSFVDVFDAYGGSALQIESGQDFTCARFDDSSLRCWGYNGSGQIGRGNTNNATLPSRIPNFAIADFSVGTSHVCAIGTDANKSLYCWGANSAGQLGNGTTTNLSSPPTTPILTNVTKVWARGNMTCAVSSGKFYCWGQNYGLFAYLPSQLSILPIPALQK